MGCDIHCHVEKKNGSKWEIVKGGFVSSMYNESSKYFSKDKFKNADTPIDERDYQLFAMLAGIRNDYGIKPIAGLRGLPMDVSNYVLTDYTEWGCDAHSPSHFLVSELVGKWTMNHDGVIGYETYKAWKESGNVYPSSWAKSVGGGMVVVHEESTMSTAEIDKSMHNYVRCKWIAREDIQVRMGNAYKQLIDRCEREDLSDVRIVFWFDN